MLEAGTGPQFFLFFKILDGSQWYDPLMLYTGAPPGITNLERRVGGAGKEILFAGV